MMWTHTLAKSWVATANRSVSPQFELLSKVASVKEGSLRLLLGERRRPAIPETYKTTQAPCRIFLCAESRARRWVQRKCHVL